MTMSDLEWNFLEFSDQALSYSPNEEKNFIDSCYLNITTSAKRCFRMWSCFTVIFNLFNKIKPTFGNIYKVYVKFLTAGNFGG